MCNGGKYGLALVLAALLVPAVTAYCAGSETTVRRGNGESPDEAPGPFNLLWPTDGEVYGCASCLPFVNFCWEESTDPDEGDTVRYDLIVHLFPDNGPDTTITVSGIGELNREVFTQPFMPGEGVWCVLAISGGDTTESNQRWTFYFVEENSVANEAEQRVPRGLVIVDFYPNPFNSAAVFRIPGAEPGKINVTLTNLLGRTVRKVVRGRPSPEGLWFAFQAGSLPAGTYLLRAEADGGETAVKKVVLLK